MTLTVCVSDVVTANDASEVLDVSSIEAMSRDAGALRPVLAPGEDGGGSETRLYFIVSDTFTAITSSSGVVTVVR